MDDSELLRELTDFYRRALLRSTRAMRFLAHEGLADPELLDRFRLGFADRTLGRALRVDDGWAAFGSRAALTRVGALRASGHELFRGCLVVPLLAGDGTVFQCAGYRIAPPRRAPTSPRWLPVDAPRLWNLAALDDDGDVVVCDDLLGAMVIWHAGHRRVIACAREPRAAEMALLVADIAACAPQLVHLALAADAPGERCAREIGAALERVGIRSHRVPLPRGYDLRTFARMHPPAEASIDALLRGVVPMAGAAHVAASPVPVAFAAPRSQPGRRGLGREIAEHLETLRALGFARSTVAARRLHLGRFAAIVARGGVRRLDAVTESVIDRFRLELGRIRPDGPLGLGTQANTITAVRMFCAWAVRARRLAADPAMGLERPRLPRRLPRAVLSATEVERVLARPDVTTRSGLRDRTILEVLYSTGIRRMELVGLELRDLDADRGLVFIREGKGRKDRWVPIGERAVHWVHRYVDEVRPTLLRAADPGTLFLNARGRPIRPSRLTERLHGYVRAASLGKTGSCHIFRHTMATLMHDGGADIRDLQEMLGHALLTTTQLYTHVSLARLKAVHTRTHPARLAP